MSKTKLGDFIIVFSVKILLQFKRIESTLLVLVTIFGLSACNTEKHDIQHTTWENYGGGPDQSKFVKTNGIDRSNVGELEEAWFYPSSDDITYHFNPIVVDTVMYVLAKNNSLVALDARTGEEIWIHAHLRGIARRGINYWESDDGEERRLLFQMNDYLQAIDAETGESISSFGDNGLVDLRRGLGRDPKTLTRVQSGNPGTIYGNFLILGSATGESYLSGPGHVRAYNVITGEQEWIFHTIPQPGEYGYDTWPEGGYQYLGGANVWGEISVDIERGIAFLPTASPKYNYYGADRIGKNLFGNSIVAVDARTGKRIWHFQTIHHDLWDYDLGAAPQLVTVNHEGKQVDVVAVAGKTGFLYVFDRVTGEPIWPIEERTVPESTVPGEQTWPTQPFPTKPEPFARQSITVDDVNPYFLTDDERENWKQRIKKLEENGRTALFTPLSHEEETIVLPGAHGGANWGGTAANPQNGMVYIITKDDPSVYPRLQKFELEEVTENESDQEEIRNPIERGRNTYMQHCEVCHGTNLEGIATAPSLINLETQLNADDFRRILASGIGEMPSFSYLSEQDIDDLYRFLGGATDGGRVELPEGPVVAQGGVPRGQVFRPDERGPVVGPGQLGYPYPEGVDAPSVRYAISGWGLGNSHIISPPWHSIVAYDLNEGVIKWHRPLGTDKLVDQKGIEKDMGTLGTVHKSMIVTSTGLVFATAGDGKIYAFDADTGNELWAKQLPKSGTGLPTMYEIDGQYYLTVTATTSVNWGGGVPEYENEELEPPSGYITFTLPKK